MRRIVLLSSLVLLGSLSRPAPALAVDATTFFSACPAMVTEDTTVTGTAVVEHCTVQVDPGVALQFVELELEVNELAIKGGGMLEVKGTSILADTINFRPDGPVEVKDTELTVDGLLEISTDAAHSPITVENSQLDTGGLSVGGLLEISTRAAHSPITIKNSQLDTGGLSMTTFKPESPLTVVGSLTASEQFFLTTREDGSPLTVKSSDVDVHEVLYLYTGLGGGDDSPVTVIDSHLKFTSEGLIDTDGQRSPITIKNSHMETEFVDEVWIRTHQSESPVTLIDVQTEGWFFNLHIGSSRRNPLTVKNSHLFALSVIEMGAGGGAATVIDSHLTVGLETHPFGVKLSFSTRGTTTVKNTYLAVFGKDLRIGSGLTEDVEVKDSVFVKSMGGMFDISSRGRTRVIGNDFTGVAGAPGTVGISGEVSCVARSNTPAGIVCK